MKQISAILNFIDAVNIPARAAKFVPKKLYVVNIKPGSHVKFGYISPNFIRWFGDKVEEPAAETTLRRYVLARRSAFFLSMQEVRDGGFVTKTTPGELYFLLEKQPDGLKSKPEPLLTNGYTNLFEMDDVNDVPRLVGARWDDNYGWYVYAHDVSDSHQWDDGRQLFSSNSRLLFAA